MLLLPSHRLHVFGASGAGTSTLGRELAERLGIARLPCPVLHLDSARPVAELVLAVERFPGTAA